jgi:cell division septum initiation protein DivIVA
VSRAEQVLTSHATDAGGGSHQAPQVETLIRRIIDLVEQARPMPLSSASMIDKEEVLDLLNESIARLPDELRAARWLLKEREEFLAKVRREGDEILELARSRAERMVQRTEVVRAAESRARQILEDAAADARRMRNETDDYCDQRLASFEALLEKTLRTVGNGRAKLQGNLAADVATDTEAAKGTPAAPGAGAAVFDQDLA